MKDTLCAGSQLKITIIHQVGYFGHHPRHPSSSASDKNLPPRHPVAANGRAVQRSSVSPKRGVRGVFADGRARDTDWLCSPSRRPVEDETVAAVLLHASRVHDNRNLSRAEALSIEAWTRRMKPPSFATAVVTVSSGRPPYPPTHPRRYRTDYEFIASGVSRTSVHPPWSRSMSPATSRVSGGFW